MRSKRAMVIVGSYYPNITANGICTDFVIKELVERGYHVDLYVLRSKLDEVDYTTTFGKVIYFDSKCFATINKLSRHNINYYSLKLPIKAVVKGYVMLESCNYEYFSYKYTDCIKFKPIIKKVLQENSIEPYDIMINVSHPFGLTKLAHKIKAKLPNIKWTQYMLDPFVYNYNHETDRIDKRKKQVKKYLATVDKLVLTRGIESENKRHGYVHGFEDKMIEVDLPNLTPREQQSNELTSSEGIECLYAGQFYQEIRNPDKMYSVFNDLKIEGLKLIILGGQNCENITAQYQQIMGDKLQMKGTVGASECVAMSYKANILVNLGNTIPNQTPSKVLEQISMGKPVINFYTNENDTSLYYFEKYPLAYNFNLSNYSQSDVEKLEQFIMENKDKQITFEQATANLTESISENVVNKIVDFITKE